MYEVVVDKGSSAALCFETAEGVFFPTDTSTLLIQAARRAIPQPGKLLDLGCGIGVCGLTLAKLGYCTSPVYLSDISERATAVARRNAERLGLASVVRSGCIFSPWQGERFDVIVDDVSGVSEEIARLSPWFPVGVDCSTGKDGVDLILSVLQQVPDFLNPSGFLLFPVLSLSNEKRILQEARSRFQMVSLLVEQSWFVPQELLEHWDLLESLMKEGGIQLEHKFGRWLWWTKIYEARAPSP